MHPNPINDEKHLFFETIKWLKNLEKIIQIFIIIHWIILDYNRLKAFNSIKLKIIIEVSYLYFWINAITVWFELITIIISPQIMPIKNVCIEGYLDCV